MNYPATVYLAIMLTGMLIPSIAHFLNKLNG